MQSNSVAVERYGYDPAGRRAWTWDGTATNYHLYNGIHVLADVNATGGLIRSYSYGMGTDNLLAFTVHTGAVAKTYYCLTDHAGTVHALADSTGAIVESYRFDPWGRVLGVWNGAGQSIAATAIGNRYLLQGREYSWRTGLYFFRARWYDPQTARWLSKDPIGIVGGLNQYMAMNDNLVRFRDPFGLCKNGDRFTEAYQNLMMTGPFDIGNILRTLAEPAIDIGQSDPYSRWQFRGGVYPSDSMGNVAAGKILAEAHGIPFAAVELALAELATNEGGWPAAIASFRDNAIGIFYALKEHPITVLQNSTMNPPALLQNWATYLGGHASQIVRDNLMFAGDKFTTWPSQR